MNLSYQKNSIQKSDINKFRSKINYILNEKNIFNKIIKDDIFLLLESVSKVLYYPIKDSVSSFFMKINGYNLVFINTHMPYENQLFSAAHELSHIISISKNREEVLVWKDLYKYFNCTLDNLDRDELISNRFASELLVNNEILENMLIQMEMNDFDAVTPEIIVRLTDLFVFPYEAMVLKLYELNKISRKKYLEFISLSNSSSSNQIFQLEKRLGLCSRNNELTNTKKFSDFIDLAINSYKFTVRTYDKLAYNLSLFDLNPQNMNVKRKRPSYNYGQSTY